ncbi:DUF4232 domain-containing protein [Saccharopolyspora sp. NPDC047091]|uniref:DUF4232 domain-containing protein n=1 Tax=Saccharopolyspora sp. NPDC047091 TaxID=3155924 RepID=UPI0033D00A5F
MPKRKLATAAVALCAGSLLLAGGGQAVAAEAANPPAGGTAASNCSGEDFAVTMRAQADPGSFLLELRNTSDRACQVGGWVRLTPQTAKGTPIDVPTDYVQVPGPPGVDEVAPGGTAYAGVRAEYGETDFNAVGFEAAPDDVAGHSMVVVEGAGEPYPLLPVTSLQVGTLQATPDGVLG